jgi:hypothetical protein
MRGLVRIEKLKDTKSRKKKLIDEKNTLGTDFKINVTDDRFSSLLDGTDARFGIDPTDPNFKNTPAMKEILSEQSRRRKRRQQKSIVGEIVDALEPPLKQQKKDDDGSGGPSRSSELHTLVSSIKRKLVKVK